MPWKPWTLLLALCLPLAAAAQIPKDVLAVGQIAEPKSLDPHTVTALNDFRILANLYEGLVRYRDGTLRIEPGLASAWTVSDDGLTYTFSLRRGVSFHDGTPFDAKAVKFNFQRLLDENHPFHDTGPFPLAFFFEAVQDIRVLDTHTIAFTLREPFAPFLSNLAYPTGFMVSPAAVRAHGRDFGRHPAGTGPFRFREWQGNQRVVLERNPDYWDGAPALAALVFRPVTDANTRTTEMLAGGLDLIVEVPPDTVDLFRSESRFRVYEQTGPHLWFLILNTRIPPFADRRMRQAVNYAVDKQALVDSVLQGTAGVAAGPIPRAFRWAYNEEVEPYPHDPAKARALIEAAGYDGRPLTFLVTEGGSGMLEPVTMATAIQADLAAVGLNVTIETYEWNTYLGKVNAGLEDAHLAEMAWMTNDPDTLPFLTLRSAALPEHGGFNSGYYVNPEVDRLLEAARRSTDQGERGAFYRQVQELVHEDAPWLFVASWKQNAVARARVEGFTLQPSFLLLLKNVTKR